MEGSKACIYSKRKLGMNTVTRQKREDSDKNGFVTINTENDVH